MITDKSKRKRGSVGNHSRNLPEGYTRFCMSAQTAWFTNHKVLYWMRLSRSRDVEAIKKLL